MWCRTVGVMVIITLSMLAAPLAAEAQPVGKVYRIGYLTDGTGAQQEYFLQGLQDLGYIEDQNLVIERRFAHHDPARLPALAAELTRLQLDVIVVGGTAAALAAKQTTATIPIVMCNSGDPVGVGLVASLARPGGNVTGLSVMSPDIITKQLDLLKEAVPALSRVGVLFHPDSSTSSRTAREIEAAAPQQSLHARLVQARHPDEFEGVFTVLAREHADGLLIINAAVFANHSTRLAELALRRHRLPTIFQERRSAAAGGLMAYGPSFAALLRRAATYVDKILKGAKPGDLPVEQPMKFELVINLKTAQALGLTIPPILLFQADEVIR
jgi:putative tryptophan/tyrosine transport system substrate-binding protein